jgi:hypothetical protein
MGPEDPLTAVAATFSKGIYIPDYVFAVFQLTFAAITVALITGGYAERMKFSAVLVFSVLWFTFAYLPRAHMVWYWDGPDAYPDAAASEVAATHAGWLFGKGAIDFAGGTVVHINAGIAALVCAIILGKRNGHGKTHFAPHSFYIAVTIRLFHLLNRAERIVALGQMARVSELVVADYSHKLSLKHLSRVVRYRLGLRKEPRLRFSKADLIKEVGEAGLELRDLIWVAPGLSEIWLAVLKKKG